MTRKQLFLVAVAVAFPLTALPLLAFAQGASGAPAAGAGPGATTPRRDPERMEKRMRLARTLGLAEALDLDAPQALKLSETIKQFDQRRLAARKQLHDARDVLRRAAQGEKVAAADVDQAIQKALEARTQMQAVDRDTIAAVTKDLTPEKKARAVLFLGKFHGRFPGPGMHGRMGMGLPGHEGGPGRGMRGDRRGGFGMGPDASAGPMMGMGPPPPDDEWDDEE